MTSQRSFDCDVNQVLAFVKLVPDQNIHPLGVRFPYPNWILMMDSINHKPLSHTVEHYPTKPVIRE